MKIQVVDPPMCCSPGALGRPANPGLERFLVDVEWLKGQGIEVERSSVYQAAASSIAPLVMETLRRKGNDCLPLTLADGEVVCQGRYPTREMLAKLAGLAAEPHGGATG